MRSLEPAIKDMLRRKRDLILTLYMQMEPRRNEYANMRYYEGSIEDDSQLHANYINCPYPDDKSNTYRKFYMVICDYKTAKTYGTYQRECPRIIRLSMIHSDSCQENTF